MTGLNKKPSAYPMFPPATAVQAQENVAHSSGIVDPAVKAPASTAPKDTRRVTASSHMASGAFGGLINDFLRPMVRNKIRQSRTD